MTLTKLFSPVGPRHTLLLIGPWSLAAVLLVLAAMPEARGAEPPLMGPGSSARGLAFARYITSLQRRDPFAHSGPVAISIDASLPDLYKQCSVLAIREPGENGRRTYHVLALEGDGAVLAEIVGRYFRLEEEMDGVPAWSAATTPDNYKFRFVGEVNTGDNSAYVYRITPKKHPQVNIAGQLWMDSGSGADVMLSGRLRGMRSIGGPADFVRETKLLKGTPYGRITHLAFSVPPLGRAQLAITEFLLQLQTDGQPPQKTPRTSAY